MYPFLSSKRLQTLMLEVVFSVGFRSQLFLGIEYCVSVHVESRYELFSKWNQIGHFPIKVTEELHVTDAIS